MATIHPGGGDSVPETAREQRLSKITIWPPNGLMEKSLFFFDINNPIRQAAIKICQPNNWFDKFILVCIVSNSVVMAMTDYSNIEGMKENPVFADRWEPSTDGSAMNTFVQVMEYPFNAVFILECVLKIIAFGFRGGHHAYIKDPWNKLDFFVVIIR